jgi:PAS domain S-box-containing protein
MVYKRFFNPYFFIFILLVLFLVVFFKDLQHKQKKVFFEKNYKKIEKIYTNYLDDMKEHSQILFFNHIQDNYELINLLKNRDKSSNKYFQIKQNLENRSNFYKKYNIKAISFYTKEFNPFFSTLEQKSKINPSYKKKLKSLKEDSLLFFISNTNSVIKFIKPIYDKKYNLSGFFEASFDLPKLSHKIFLKEDFAVTFVFKKILLENKLENKLLKKYSAFKYDEEYLYEKSFFSSRENLPSKNLEDEMNENSGFSTVLEVQDEEYIKTFLPFYNSFTKEKIGYAVFTKKDLEYSKISNKYNLIILFNIALAFLFLSSIYFYNKRKNRCLSIEAKLESIMRSIDKYVIVVETNTKGDITYASQAFCDISGYKKEEILNKPVNIIRSPDISKKFFEKMWGKISKGEVWEGEIKNLDKNGNSYWERGSISPLYDQNKNLTGYRAIKVNITDEKQLQKLNSILKKELFSKISEIKTMDQLRIDESKVKLMSQILDTFSNEWKKPISNLSSSILEFENRVDKARYTKSDLKEFLFHLREEVKTLSINLNEFRKFFIDSDENDKYNVYSVIKSVVDSIYEKNISLNIKGDKNLETYGIFYELRKVVSGIVTNSLDAFKSKNIENGKIDIEIIDKKEFLLIKIEDNAGGIPEEILPKIFDHNFSTKYYTNTEGLPLYLAKLIIEKAKGEIWVENINNGCCFFIKLNTEDRREKRREI